MGIFGTAQDATNKGNETDWEGERLPPITSVVCVFTRHASRVTNSPMGSVEVFRSVL